MTPSQRLERLVALLAEAESDRDELLSAVQLIVERWDSGDLAEAVRHADAVSRDIRRDNG